MAVSIWGDSHEATQVEAGAEGADRARRAERPIGELCAEHEMSQAKNYQWRDQFLADAAKAFEPARYVDGLVINQKRVDGLMKAADLLVRPNPKPRARRKADTKKPKPSRPNEWWGIDMTKVMIEGFGWVYLVIVLDWHTRKVVGHHAGAAGARLALAAGFEPGREPPVPGRHRG